jgi:hypothetical protein
MNRKQPQGLKARVYVWAEAHTYQPIPDLKFYAACFTGITSIFGNCFQNDDLLLPTHRRRTVLS